MLYVGSVIGMTWLLAARTEVLTWLLAARTEVLTWLLAARTEVLTSGRRQKICYPSPNSSEWLCKAKFSY
jgi:hypothetical protein